MAQQLRKFIMAIPLAAILILSVGCSSSTDKGTDSAAQADPAIDSSGEQPFSEIAATPVSDSLDGLDQLNSLIKAFKQAVEADDQEGAEQTTKQIIGIWKSLEDDLLAHDQQKSELVRNNLVELLSQVRSKEQKEQLVDVSYQLYQTFRDLREKVQAAQP